MGKERGGDRHLLPLAGKSTVEVSIVEEEIDERLFYAPQKQGEVDLLRGKPEKDPQMVREPLLLRELTELGRGGLSYQEYKSNATLGTLKHGASSSTARGNHKNRSTRLRVDHDGQDVAAHEPLLFRCL